jgi:hypothetical protein
MNDPFYVLDRFEPLAINCCAQDKPLFETANTFGAVQFDTRRIWRSVMARRHGETEPATGRHDAKRIPTTLRNAFKMNRSGCVVAAPFLVVCTRIGSSPVWL